LEGISSQARVRRGLGSDQPYWTSSTTAFDPTQAWTVFSCDFGAYALGKTVSGHSLAVRDRVL
jgi:hypothetical protein